MQMVTLHFKTGTKQTLAVKSVMITQTHLGLEKVKLTYLDGQAGIYDHKNIAAVFIEGMETT